MRLDALPALPLSAADRATEVKDQKLKLPAFFRGQPKGVYLVFSVEFWERFSYYGFIAILVLWLTASARTGGLGWDHASALLLVGFVTGLMWVVPILGGAVADRWWGARRAVAVGSLGLALGNALLSLAAFLPQLLFSPQELAGNPRLGQLTTHFGERDIIITAIVTAGMLSMIAGAGLFKANASSLLSEQFGRDDPRRGNGFTLFYMGINLGALAAPFGAGTAGERIGWGYGYMAASIGMLVGFLTLTLLGPRSLERPASLEPKAAAGKPDRSGIWLAFVLVPFATIFMTGLMQYSGLINLFAAERVSRELGGFTIPATWFLSINPFVILAAGPFVASFWERVDRRAGREVFAFKIAAGLFLMAAAFELLAAGNATSRGFISPLYLIGFWITLTIGELSLIPVGLALMGKIAPPRAVGTLMGIWLFTMGVGSMVAGKLGALAQSWGDGPIFHLMSAAGAIGGSALLLISSRLHSWGEEIVRPDEGA